MSKLNAVLLGLGLGLSFVAVAQADPVLGLKPGLWQSSAQVKMSMSSAMSMPGVDTSKLSPAQRAQIQQMMGQMAATPRPPIVTKSCITAKQLENPENFAPENRPDCTQTIVKRTGNEIQAKVVCTGKDAANMTGDFKSSSSTAYSGVLSGTVSAEGRTIPISDTIQGQWLSADCGTVKPIDLAAKPSVPNVKPVNPATPN